MTTSPLLETRLQRVRSHYRVSPWLQARADESPLLRSWQRCHDAGMQEAESIHFELVSRSLLASLDDAHGALVRAARPETERLAHAVRGTGCAVMLFNHRAVVIDRLCHEASTPAALLASSRIGVNVAEPCVGTTAPAIALADGLPYLVGREAHFFSSMRPFFCVAAPIDAPTGERLGALDITAYDNVPAFDIFSLVVDAAVAIENSLFQPSADRLVVHFHPRAELLGTPLAGLLMVAADGRLCGANRVAARLLCQPRAGLLGQAFSALFDRRLQALFARTAGQRGADVVEMQTRAGLQVQARFEGESRRDAVPGRWATAPAGADPAAVAATAPMPQGQHGARPTPALNLATNPPNSAPDNAPEKLQDLEREAIARTLAALGGNVSAAARQLGISRNTIYRRRNGPL